jgi:hypothetical protein
VDLAVAGSNPVGHPNLPPNCPVDKWIAGFMDKWDSNNRVVAVCQWRCHRKHFVVISLFLPSVFFVVKSATLAIVTVENTPRVGRASLLQSPAWRYHSHGLTSCRYVLHNEKMPNPPGNT